MMAEASLHVTEGGAAWAFTNKPFDSTGMQCPLSLQSLRSNTALASAGSQDMYLEKKNSVRSCRCSDIIAFFLTDDLGVERVFGKDDSRLRRVSLDSDELRHLLTARAKDDLVRPG